MMGAGSKRGVPGRNERKWSVVAHAGTWVLQNAEAVPSGGCVGESNRRGRQDESYGDTALVHNIT